MATPSVELDVNLRLAGTRSKHSVESFPILKVKVSKDNLIAGNGISLDLNVPNWGLLSYGLLYIDCSQRPDIF